MICAWQLCKSRYLFNAYVGPRCHEKYAEYNHPLNLAGKGFVNILTPTRILIELFTFYWEGVDMLCPGVI